MMMNRLAPVAEEPSNEENKAETWTNWVRSHFPHKKSHLRILLSVLACPLFPLPLQIQFPPISQVSSSAQYIIQHFTAATGCRKMDGAVKNMYASGKVAMSMAEEGAKVNGCFVIWQMVPDKWLIELVVGGHKVLAGSDGSVAWRQTPWVGAHAAKGGVRPLRRALQGLDPAVISRVFWSASYVGEKQAVPGGASCFVLKVSAEQGDLAERSDSIAEMIKHVSLGYFCQRSGLLVSLEDSYLTRIQTPGSHPAYWETTMRTRVEDYRAVDGIMVAHSGHSTVVITTFGGSDHRLTTTVQLDETYTIDDLAFNVPGLSLHSFIPPSPLLLHHPQA